MFPFPLAHVMWRKIGYSRCTTSKLHERRLRWSGSCWWWSLSSSSSSRGSSTETGLHCSSSSSCPLTFSKLAVSSLPSSCYNSFNTLLVSPFVAYYFWLGIITNLSCSNLYPWRLYFKLYNCIHYSSIIFEYFYCQILYTITTSRVKITFESVNLQFNTSLKRMQLFVQNLDSCRCLLCLAILANSKLYPWRLYFMLFYSIKFLYLLLSFSLYYNHK